MKTLGSWEVTAQSNENAQNVLKWEKPDFYSIREVTGIWQLNAIAEKNKNFGQSRIKVFLTKVQKNFSLKWLIDLYVYNLYG